MLVKFFKQTWLVMMAALVFGLLVAGVEGMLRPRIERNNREKLNRELRLLFGQDSSFEEKTVADAQGKEQVYYLGKDGERIVGYAFRAVGSGFADKIELLVAMDVTWGKILGIAVLKSNETPGFGDKMKEDPFKNQFKNCPAGDKLAVIKTGDRSKADREIVAITGATVTSEAVVKTVNDELKRMKLLLPKYTEQGRDSR